MPTDIDAIAERVVAKLATNPAMRSAFGELLASVSPDEAAAFFENVRPAFERALAPRVLRDGADITTLRDGTEVWGGPSRFPVVNIIGGTAFIHDEYDRNQLDIGVGGGADCMFDYLVSPCFADLQGFAEGDTYTALSGCTFRCYSTIQGAVSQAATDLGANEGATIFVCGGVYDELINFTNGASTFIQLVGAGANRTLIKPTSGTTAIGFSGASALATAHVFMDIGVDTSLMAAGARAIVNGNAGCPKRVLRCYIKTAAGHTGIVGGTGSGFAWEIDTCQFDGTGTGITLGNSIGADIDSCIFTSLAVGIDVQHAAIADIRGCSMTGVTTAVKFSSNAADVTINGNRIVNCTTGILATPSSGLPAAVSIAGNVFWGNTTAIDFSGLVGDMLGCTISANAFEKGIGTSGIKLHATRFKHGIIIGNEFTGFTAGNEISGMTVAQAIAADTQIAHNSTDSGTALPDSGLGHVGSGSGMGAPNNARYLVLASDATLTDERIWTPGSGLQASDGGAGGAYTVKLGNLTEAWHNADTGTNAIYQDGSFAAGVASTATPANALTLDLDGAVFTGRIGALTTSSIPAGLLFKMNGTSFATLIGASIGLARSRGTHDSPTVVSSGDVLGGLQIFGYDGVHYQQAAQILAYVDAAAGANDMPTRLVFRTTPDGAKTAVERMRINSAGGVSIGTGASADAKAILDLKTTTAGLGLLIPVQTTANAPSSAPDGMLWYDSTTGRFRGRENGADVDMRITSDQKRRAIVFVIDGGGSAITTGVKGELPVPYGCTVVEWRIYSDQSGSIVVDIWKDSHANYPPTVADTITGSDKPTLSSTDHNKSTALTGWTTALSDLDVLRYNVDSASTVTRVTVALIVTVP